MSSPKLLIYNLFPRLVGPFPQWDTHFRRAKDLGFTHIFINPVQYPGFSGSLYAIKDFYTINPLFLDPESDEDGWEQLRQVVRRAKDMGLEMMMDLVINHVARDSVLVEKYSAWIKKDSEGEWVSPGAWDDIAQKRVVWGDLIEIDNELSSDRTQLWQYWCELVLNYCALGFTAFRADAAYQVPAQLWSHLFDRVKERYPDTLFVAETLGCTPDETVETAKSGFDFVFNSSKYWNFSDYWCLDQYELFRKYTRTVSFAESHDTPRLMAEAPQDLDWVKMRYAFSSVFSSALLMPVGFEYGFKKKLDVRFTTPDDWEETSCDITQFIQYCNHFKEYPVFQFDNSVELIENPNSNVMILLKKTDNESQQALIIINKDYQHYQYVEFSDLFEIFGRRRLIVDISPEYRLDFIPEHFEYHLRPSQMIVFIQN